VLREDGSPPLYYMTLHVWMKAFGDSEEATHALSVIFATLCIPGRLLGRGPPLGPPRRLVRRVPRRAGPVPDRSRPGDADVRDGPVPVDPRDRLLPARLRAAPTAAS